MRSIEEEAVLLTIDELVRKYRKKPQPAVIIAAIEKLKSNELDHIAFKVPPEIQKLRDVAFTRIILGAISVLHVMLHNHEIHPTDEELCYLTWHVIRLMYKCGVIQTDKYGLLDLLNRVKGIA